MTTADDKVDRAADKLQETADRLAADGGLKAKVAEELADDAAFVRKLKPSLMRARFRGELPTDGEPGAGVRAPQGPQLGQRPEPKPPSGGGPNPFVVVGAAFAVGILIAKIIDWRGHAHPR